MRLADHVDPKRLKELNLLLLLEGAKQVGGGAELRKRTRERALLVAGVHYLKANACSRGVNAVGVLGFRRDNAIQW